MKPVMTSSSHSILTPLHLKTPTHKGLWLVIGVVGVTSLLFAEATDTGLIDGVAPGDLFSYGVHELKWEADANGNRFMDVGEVQVKRGGHWTVLEEKEFVHTVKRRRSQLYMENAYVYKKTPTRDLELYIDFPEDWKASDQRPVMLWFFGGAWNTGTPFAFKAQSLYFAQRGVVGVCVDYRIRTVDGIPTDGYLSGHDAKSAIRWVRKNAAQLGIDPDRIMAGGDSAGGHLALATQIDSLNDPEDDLSISTKVVGLALHNPYVVLINPKSWVYQIDFKTLPPLWVGYSLNDHAAYTDDPTSKRTERNGERLVKELELAGIPLRTYIKPDGGHGFCSGPPHLRTSTEDIDLFFQECGLLEPGTAELPDKQTGGFLGKQHLLKIEAGNATRSVPRSLEFVTRVPSQN